MWTSGTITSVVFELTGSAGGGLSPTRSWITRTWSPRTSGGVCDRRKSSLRGILCVLRRQPVANSTVTTSQVRRMPSIVTHGRIGRLMRALTVEELDAVADELDRDVLRTPAIDRFCSSSSWVLPASAALMPPRQSWIRRGEASWLLTMVGRHTSGIAYVEPLELAWGMACPLIGPDPRAAAEEVAIEIASRRDWNVMLIAGL